MHHGENSGQNRKLSQIDSLHVPISTVFLVYGTLARCVPPIYDDFSGRFQPQKGILWDSENTHRTRNM